MLKSLFSQCCLVLFVCFVIAFFESIAIDKITKETNLHNHVKQTEFKDDNYYYKFGEK